jgi:hypothetical protein
MRWKFSLQESVLKRVLPIFTTYGRNVAATYIRYSDHIAMFLTPSDDHYLYCRLPAFSHSSFLSLRFQGDCIQVAQQEIKKVNCVIIETRTVYITEV